MSEKTLPDIPYTTVAANVAEHTNLLAYALRKNCSADLLEWMALHHLLIQGHGTRGKYQRRPSAGEKGCRCYLCKHAQHVHNTSPAQRKYRQQHESRRKLAQEDLARSLLDDEL